MSKKQSLSKWLSNYNPKPSDQFYNKMERAPWQEPGKSKHKITRRTFHPGWQFALALFLVLAMFSLAIPSVRASVEVWLGLSVAPSNQMPVDAATLIGVTPTTTINPTSTAFPIQNPAPQEDIPTELSSLSNPAGWEILSPSYLPDGYHFESAYLDTNHKTVFATYMATITLPGASDAALTQTKTITFLQAQSNDFVPMEVAPSASLTEVEVNGQPGVYTIGAWDTQFVPDSNAPNGGSMLSTWRNDLLVKNLYWQVGDIYTLLVTDDEGVSQEALISMAESVKR